MSLINHLQNQWLVLALAGGLVIVLCLALYYLAMWQERSATGAQPLDESTGERRRWHPPALLIFTYAFVLVWAVVYTLMMIWNPPNW